MWIPRGYRPEEMYVAWCEVADALGEHRPVPPWCAGRVMEFDCEPEELPFVTLGEASNGSL